MQRRPKFSERSTAEENVDPASNYFRPRARLRTPPGPHEWLSRFVIVGTGEKYASHSIFHYFIVR